MMLGILLSLALLQAGSWQLDFDVPCGTKVQRLPEVRKGVMLPEAVLNDSYSFDGREREVVGVWTFLGIDPGDKIEFDVNVYLDGVPVVLRSEHKPLSNDYDAWRWYPNYNIKPGPVERVSIDVVANVTGKNEVTPRAEGKDTARPHYGVWVVYACAMASEPVDPPPSDPVDPPVDEKKATDYIPMQDREEWAEKVDSAYSEWRGDRDLAYLAVHAEVVAAFGFDADKLVDDVAALLRVHEERNALSHRVATAGEHPDFSGRLRVRKEVVSDFVRRAAEVQKTSYQPYVDAAAAKGVSWGVGFDSWQGFISSPSGWVLWRASH